MPHLPDIEALSMTNRILEGIGERILSTTEAYVSRKSVTGTPEENCGAAFFTGFFGETPYFQAHPELNGTIQIEGDPLSRSARYALYLGQSQKTVVMLHHFDVVPADDYRAFASLAYQPHALEAALEAARAELAQEALCDLESGSFLWGHGVCDMKGGASVQMVLMERLSQTGFPLSLIVLGVPDEENMSAGMRAAIPFLNALRRRYGLEYVLSVNSEPHQRRAPDTGVFSTGSIGKLLPFVYARGIMAHAGKSLEGLNPAGIMGEILIRTEAAADFADRAKGESAPPPTWLYLKDDKKEYDVSMPRSMFGMMSMLTLSASPADVMAKLKRVCSEALCAASQRVFDGRAALGVHSLRSGQWTCRALSFREAFAEAGQAGGEAFSKKYIEGRRLVLRALRSGELNAAEAQRRLADMLADGLPGDDPVVIYGLMPPFYPHVDGDAVPGFENVSSKLALHLIRFAGENLAEKYEAETFYTGISDLSYIACARSGDANALEGFMPLLGEAYSLPVSDMAAVAAPCINIGPWGKDFHKLTERVMLRDLTAETPALLLEALEWAAVYFKESEHKAL